MKATIQLILVMLALVLLACALWLSFIQKDYQAAQVYALVAGILGFASYFAGYLPNQ